MNPSVPQLLPVACLLCGAPYVTAEWRATPSPYGVIYLCDDCCRRLGPGRASVMARHFLAVVTRLTHNLPITHARAPHLPGDGDS